MTAPCPRCPPDYCHAPASAVYDHQKHIMSFIREPDCDFELPEHQRTGRVYYCARCLQRIEKGQNGDWVSRQIIREWP